MKALLLSTFFIQTLFAAPCNIKQSDPKSGKVNDIFNINVNKCAEDYLIGDIFGYSEFCGCVDKYKDIIPDSEDSMPLNSKLEESGKYLMSELEKFTTDLSLVESNIDLGNDTKFTQSCNISNIVNVTCAGSKYSKAQIKEKINKMFGFYLKEDTQFGLPKKDTTTLQSLQERIKEKMLIKLSKSSGKSKVNTCIPPKYNTKIGLMSMDEGFIRNSLTHFIGGNGQSLSKLLEEENFSSDSKVKNSEVSSIFKNVLINKCNDLKLNFDKLICNKGLIENAKSITDDTANMSDMEKDGLVDSLIFENYAASDFKTASPQKFKQVCSSQKKSNQTTLNDLWPKKMSSLPSEDYNILEQTKINAIENLINYTKKDSDKNLLCSQICVEQKGPYSPEGCTVKTKKELAKIKDCSSEKIEAINLELESQKAKDSSYEKKLEHIIFCKSLSIVEKLNIEQEIENSSNELDQKLASGEINKEEYERVLKSNPNLSKNKTPILDSFLGFEKKNTPKVLNIGKSDVASMAVDINTELNTGKNDIKRAKSLPKNKKALSISKKESNNTPIVQNEPTHNTSVSSNVSLGGSYKSNQGDKIEGVSNDVNTLINRINQLRDQNSDLTRGLKTLQSIDHRENNRRSVYSFNQNNTSGQKRASFNSRRTKTDDLISSSHQIPREHYIQTTSNSLTSSTDNLYDNYQEQIATNFTDDEEVKRIQDKINQRTNEEILNDKYAANDSQGANSKASSRSPASSAQSLASSTSLKGGKPADVSAISKLFKGELPEDNINQTISYDQVEIEISPTVHEIKLEEFLAKKHEIRPGQTIVLYQYIKGKKVKVKIEPKFLNKEKKKSFIGYIPTGINSDNIELAKKIKAWANYITF